MEVTSSCLVLDKSISFNSVSFFLRQSKSPYSLITLLQIRQTKYLLFTLLIELNQWIDWKNFSLRLMNHKSPVVPILFLEFCFFGCA